jgi:hypothetical protein
MKIVEKMKELVPEYVSKNSIFEQLDHKNWKLKIPVSILN